MNDLEDRRRLRQLIFAVAILLTFEGLLRKAAPSILSVPLFLFKDVLVMTMAVYCARIPFAPMIRTVWNAYVVLFVLMLPCILVTTWNDPILGIFGIKQYLLYPVVGFATFLAFEKSGMETILSYFRWISLLVIPTTLLAFVQLHLPYDHWLNMSVRGESMAGFMAAGELRVSSTFSFVAQFCIFLNAEIFIVMVALHQWSRQNIFWKLILPLLIPAIVAGSFITGSRSAVVGNLAIILVAMALVMMKFQLRNVFQIGLMVLALFVATMAINHFSPRTTAAYNEREKGRLIGFSAEIKERVLGSYFGGIHDKSMRTLFGNGLGVMSNGSDTFSRYAAGWRVFMWTETDFATTLFEGGYYLVVVWYGFRLFIILYTLRFFLVNITPEYSVPVAFCQAFVIVVGGYATLALQPPVAIWCWFGVGTSLLFAWKCVAPPDSEEKDEDINPPRPPMRKIRGRSLYADVIHNRK